MQTESHDRWRSIFWKRRIIILSATRAGAYEWECRRHIAAARGPWQRTTHPTTMVAHRVVAPIGICLVVVVVEVSMIIRRYPSFGELMSFVPLYYYTPEMRERGSFYFCQHSLILPHCCVTDGLLTYSKKKWWCRQLTNMLQYNDELISFVPGSKCSYRV